MAQWLRAAAELQSSKANKIKSGGSMWLDQGIAVAEVEEGQSEMEPIAEAKDEEDEPCTASGSSSSWDEVYLTDSKDAFGGYIRLLGEGTFSKVWLAKGGSENGLGDGAGGEVVKKVPKSQEFYESIEIEHRMLTQLSHENIITALGLEYLSSSDAGDLPVLVLEFCEEGSLADRLAMGPPLPEAMVAKYFIGIMSGLQTMHHLQVAHFDVKPDNCLFRNQDTLVLADLGCARRLQQDERVFDAVGSPYYLPPEFYACAGISFEADIWSIGITLHESVFGLGAWGDLNEGMPLESRIRTAETALPSMDLAVSTLQVVCISKLCLSCSRPAAEDVGLLLSRVFEAAEEEAEREVAEEVAREQEELSRAKLYMLEDDLTVAQAEKDELEQIASRAQLAEEWADMALANEKRVRMDLERAHQELQDKFQIVAGASEKSISKLTNAKRILQGTLVQMMEWKSVQLAFANWKCEARMSASQRRLAAEREAAEVAALEQADWLMKQLEQAKSDLQEAASKLEAKKRGRHHKVSFFKLLGSFCQNLCS